MLNGSSFAKDFDMHLFEFLTVDKMLMLLINFSFLV